MDDLSIWKELNQKGVTVLFQDINKDTASPVINTASFCSNRNLA